MAEQSPPRCAVCGDPLPALLGVVGGVGASIVAKRVAGAFCAEACRG